MHHLALLLVRGTCRNIGVHLSYKHSLIAGFVKRNLMHHLALLLVERTCRNIGVHLSYKHSLIVGFVKG